ncbi:hypothetical protein K469DRAFT_719724 [Zopfia rhizophila CBS 207.26]|uniref:F-box domain-containing protein n=1 Tax=Zopfia rhizophila CBS 207.26 TaxID=1314779 RepID=A0A6A6DGW6_9PEZI|nr:hypothetical protein K469DRAFT_719724 [Zopfia rhizophila CBS 207.26]
MYDRHSDNDEPLEDNTIAIPLCSKRTKRMQRKRAKREQKRREPASLLQLPAELLVEIMQYLRPSDVFNCARVNYFLSFCVFRNANAIGREIIKRRYAILTQCFPIPTLMSHVDPEVQAVLITPDREALVAIHKKPYQHIQPPDPYFTCTCLTCILTWNNLSLIVDFAHWQENLDNGEPIPMLPRGQKTEWNKELVDQNAAVVRKALRNTLWYAQILERHLQSTVRAIRRHQGNKGNKRRHFDMTEVDAQKGTDEFLAKSGPPSLEFPFHRDNYYLL